MKRHPFAILVAVFVIAAAAFGGTYVSTGEPRVEDVLPDPLASSADLRSVVGASAMVGDGAMNLSLGRYDEDNNSPVNPRAAKRLAEIAAARGMSLTLDAEATYHYDSALWVRDEAECKRRIHRVATVLSIWKAYAPDVPRYVFNGTPGKLSDNAHRGAVYNAFADYEASLLAPLVSGFNVDNYKRPWNDLDHWTAESNFYRDEGRKRYPGKGKLVVSAQEWDEVGRPVGYVGDAAMLHFTRYGSANRMHVEWWGLSHTTLGPQPRAWAWLRKSKGK